MAGAFITTKWSILQRIRSENEEDAAEAMDLLCRTYWLPLYAWLRGNGHSPEEAQDLTQGFFAHAIRRNIFQKADTEKGKLRNFLLTCLKRYVADWNEKKLARKRKGQAQETPLHFVNAHTGEVGIRHDLAAPESDPAELYERNWAMSLLQAALARLRKEHEDKGKGDLYQALNPMLSDLDPGQSYPAAAGELKTSEGAVRIAFHRFKIRYREIVQEEVARTLLPGDDLEEEMRHLMNVLGG